MLFIGILAAALFIWLLQLNAEEQGKAVMNRYCLSECIDEQYHNANS